MTAVVGTADCRVQAPKGQVLVAGAARSCGRRTVAHAVGVEPATKVYPRVNPFSPSDPWPAREKYRREIQFIYQIEPRNTPA